MRDLLKHFESSIDAARTSKDLHMSLRLVNKFLNNIAIYAYRMTKFCPHIQTDIHDMSVMDERDYDSIFRRAITIPGDQRDTIAHSMDVKHIIKDTCSEQVKKVMEFMKQLAQLRKKIKYRYEVVLETELREERDREISRVRALNGGKKQKRRKKHTKKHKKRKRMRKKRVTKKRKGKK